jgi:hypothetical protein
MYFILRVAVLVVGCDGAFDGFRNSRLWAEVVIPQPSLGALASRRYHDGKLLITNIMKFIVRKVAYLLLVHYVFFFPSIILVIKEVLHVSITDAARRLSAYDLSCSTSATASVYHWEECLLPLFSSEP